MIICAFENSPSIPSFLVTKIVYIGYGQLKKLLLFLLPSHICASCIFISYCCLCQCQAVCYYMLVPTKYHWNISFQKKRSSKYAVKNARNVTQFVSQVDNLFLNLPYIVVGPCRLSISVSVSILQDSCKILIYSRYCF